MITDERVKNIAAQAQLIIVEALPLLDGDSQEHPFGDS